jgi:hypothetical protein
LAKLDKRSIPILEAEIEQAPPSTHQIKLFHAQHHCKAAFHSAIKSVDGMAPQPDAMAGIIRCIESARAEASQPGSDSHRRRRE